MKKALSCKIISVISAFALLASTLGIFTSVFAGASDATGLTLQQIAESADIKVSNETTKADIETALKKLTLSDGKTVTEVTDFYKINSFEGAIERGSTYAGASEEDVVLAEGIDGIVTAVVTVKAADGTTSNDVVNLTIKPSYAYYSFSSVSTDSNFTNDNGEWKYTGAVKEKIVVPDYVNKLATWWISWDATPRCIVYGSGVTQIPRQDALSSLEVVSFKGKVTSFANQAFYNCPKLKHIILPDTTKSIGADMFRYNTAMEQLYLPEGLESIGLVFNNASEDSAPGHKLTELTIPSTVTYIANNAFAGASLDCTVTVLTKSDNLWETNAFYNPKYPTFGEKITLRVYRDGLADKNYATAKPKEYLDDMSLAEAVARAMLTVNKKGKLTVKDGTEVKTNADTLIKDAKTAYADISAVSLSWKSSDWSNNNGVYSNSLVFTKGDVTLEIPYSMAEPGKLDLQAIVDEKGFSVESGATGSDLVKAFNESGILSGYTVTAITENYRLAAVNGAVEKGSTYEGAPEEEILVEGKKGYLAATVTLEDSNGTTYSANVVLGIKPAMSVYSFSSVSSDSDWVYNSASWGLRWEYKPHGDTWGNSAQKVIVPDKVNELKAGWHDFVDISKAKCIVYNDQITKIPVQHSLHGLEVAVLKGNVTEISGAGTGYNAAFRDCGSLKFINLPDSLKTIGNKAFYKCSGLVSFVLPDGVETIGDNLFFDPDDSSHEGYNFTSLTIPSSVKSIGQYAFADAKSGITVDILTDAEVSETDGIHPNAFAKSDKGYSDNITLRVVKGGNADTDSLYTKNAKTYFDTVSLGEAAARAKQKADLTAGEIYNSADEVKAEEDSIKSAITTAFGNASSISASWKNDAWSDSNGILTNTLVLSKDGGSYNISVKMYAPGAYDLQAVIDDSGLYLTNSVSEKSLVKSLNSLNIDGYTVKEVTEFYKLAAVDSAVEKGSTYEGAVDGEVLVEGKNGYVTAVVSLEDKDGKPFRSCITVDVKPTVTEYSFSSVSTDADWTYNSAGWAKRWEYHPVSEKAAQKLVIPDFVTELKDDWATAWTYDFSKNVKCIVYNENITVIPAVQYNFHSVQVIALKGEVTEILGGSKDAAFKDCGSLKHIRIPDTVKVIGEKAFYNCASLTSLYLPEGLEEIGDKLFFDPSEGSHPTYNITEITIPTTVKAIGKYAFLNASGCTVTMLTTAEVGNGGIDPEAFYSEDYKDYSAKAALRVVKGSKAEGDTLLAASGKKSVIDDSITVTEAAARAIRKNEAVSGSVYEDLKAVEKAADSIKAQLISSFGSAKTVEVKWKNKSWSENGALIENTLVISKNGASFEIPVYMYKANSFDLQTVIDKSDLHLTNETTKGSLLEALKGLKLSKGYEVTAVTDFYKLNAVDGAIEIGSTYKGAVDGEILSQGEKGYISAVVSLKDEDGVPYTSAVIIEIEPIMEEFSFASVSSEKDFTYNSSSWAKRWEYHPMTGVAAEKIVIPDKVTELKNDWHQAWQYDVRKNVRCIIYNESITSIPAQYNLYALEIACFKGKVTELKSDGTNAAFKDCSNLKYLKLPDSIKTLEKRALYNCTSLKTLYLPEGLEEIGDEMFFSPSQENHPGYNLTEITIPSTVKKIGQYAFVNANNSCEITLLSTAEADDKNGIHSEAFYSSDYASRSSNVTLRVIEGSPAASSALPTAANKKLLLQESMGFAEAAARASKKADLINGSKVTLDEYEAMLSVAYGNVTVYKTGWESKVWKRSGDYSENYWLISKNGTSFRIYAKVNIVEVDLQKEIDKATLGASDETDEEELKQRIDGILPAGYNLEELIQYYKVSSVDGAVDVTNGNSEILVPGHSGSIRAVAEVLKPDGKTETVYVSETIAQKLTEYTFNSVSVESDFEITDGVLVKYSGNAEKVVIPEGVTALGDKWLSGISAKQSDYSAADTSIKCIVYPESLKGTVPEQSALCGLEVVSFKGNGVKTIGEKAFFGAEKLEYIEIPDSVEKIGAEAFKGISSDMSCIYLPDGITEIGDSAFENNSFKEITVPQSVKKIGKKAFATASDSFTVTVLNEDIPYSDGAFDGTAVTVRAFKGGEIYKQLKKDGKYTLVKLDGMLITEAAARLDVKSEAYARHEYPSDIKPQTVAEALVLSYAEHEDFTYGWNNSWDTSTDARRSGTLYLSDGKYTLGVKVELNVPPVYTLEDLVSSVKDITANAAFTNSLTEKSYKDYIEEKIPGKYKVEIVEYNMQRAVDGAADSTGTLVSGLKGSAAAVIRVTDYYGNSKEILCESVVNPVIEQYQFASTSKSGDFILSDDGTVLLEYYGTAEKIVVPDGVTRIANSWMWRKPSYVKALILPESLKVIPDNLCDGMTALEVVSMKNNVISVGKATFANCYSLKYLQLSDNLEEISESMFQNTYSLIDVRIPNSVLKIGKQAFYGSAVRSITVSSEVMNIGENAFSNMLGSEKYIGSDYFSVDDGVKQSVIDWVAESGISEMPTYLTFLCKSAAVEEKNFATRGEASPKYIIRAYSDSAVYKTAEKVIAAAESAADKYELQSLDMSLTEAAARANTEARSLVLYNGMSSADIASRISGSFVSSAVNSNAVWSKALTSVKAEADKAGNAKGTLSFTSKDGKFTFNAVIDSKMLFARPELSDSDTMGDFWDDNWDDDLWDDLEDNEFFEDLFEDMFEDFDDDFEDDFDASDDFDSFDDDEAFDSLDGDTDYTDGENNGNSDTEGNKNTVSEKNGDNTLAAVIAGIIALLLICAVIILIIILKKRKKASE